MKNKKVNWEKVRLYITLIITVYTCIMAIITFATIDTRWYMLSVWLFIVGCVLFDVMYLLEMLIEEKNKRKK